MFHRKQVILPSQSSSEASKPLFLRQKYLSFHLQLVFCISLFVLQNFLLLARVLRHRHALLKVQLHEAPRTRIAVCLLFSSLLVMSFSALHALFSSSHLLYCFPSSLDQLLGDWVFYLLYYLGVLKLGLGPCRVMWGLYYRKTFYLVYTIDRKKYNNTSLKDVYLKIE